MKNSTFCHFFVVFYNVIPKDRIKLLTDKYISILDTSAGEYEKNPPAKDFMDGYNLYKRLRDYQTDHLYFLSHPEINYTNNISERQLLIYEAFLHILSVYHPTKQNSFIFVLYIEHF